MLYAALAARVEEVLLSLHAQLTGEVPATPAEAVMRPAHLAGGRLQELAGRSLAPRELWHVPLAGFTASDAWASRLAAA